MFGSKKKTYKDLKILVEERNPELKGGKWDIGKENLYIRFVARDTKYIIVINKANMSKVDLYKEVLSNE